MATAMSPAGGLSRKALNAISTRRRFRLHDALILVAATGVACGLMLAMERVSSGQISWSALPSIFKSYSRLPGASHFQALIYAIIEATFLIFLLALPFAGMWTLALIPIRLTGPRPRFRRLATQPGTMAAFAASLALAIVGIQAGIVLWKASGDSLYMTFILAAMPVYPGLAVLFTWFTLLFGRRWRAEPSWIDRMGRALGIFWIVEGVFVSGFLLYGISG
jgi:hypothetical protein